MRKLSWLCFLLLLSCSSSHHGSDPALLEPKPPDTPVPQIITFDSDHDIFDAIHALWSFQQQYQQTRQEIFSKRLSKEPMFRRLSTQALQERDYSYLFTGLDGPTQWYSLLMDALSKLPQHGLIITEDYPIAVLQEAQGAYVPSEDLLRRQTELYENPLFQAMEEQIFATQEPTREQIDTWLQTRKFPRVKQQVFQHMAQRFVTLLEAKAAQDPARIDIEVPASVAFFRYATDIRHRIIAHPFKADRSPKRVDIYHAEALAESFQAFFKDPAQGLAALIPPHPNYQKTVTGLAWYRKIAEAGGFTRITYTGKLKRGSHGNAVQKLKTRLQEEGYFSGTIDNRFDEDLERAFTLYQKTHGYNPTGILEDRHIISLNIPVETRIRQIELSLQRWRETAIDTELPLYLRVNIPEFMVEIWENGSLVKKHKVIIGNNNMDYDPQKKVTGRINRTKIFEATLQQVILNPRWHVPSRIQKLEIDYDLMRQPDYYAKNNFKVRVLPDGREQIYQDSGIGNTLGRVKFNFPNPFGIFMHDTAQKSLFDREIRAFSHGCIRLHDPLEVANFLLDRRLGMSPKEVDNILDKKIQRELNLKEPVPFYAEYNSVGVDDVGRMMFFSDIYQYDKDFFDGKIPYSEAELKILLREISKID